MRASRSLALVAAAIVMAVAGCSAPGGPGAAGSWDWRPDAGPGKAEAGSGDGGITPITSAATCTAAHTSLPLPARSSVMSAEAGGHSKTNVYTEDLFNLFKGLCGSCHVGPGQGSFNVTAATFSQVVTQKALDLIQSDDSSKFMPPLAAGGKSFSSRGDNDPVVRLASLMSQWIAQGRPNALFTIDSDHPGSASFALSPEVGSQMTNLGDCVPSRGLYATSDQTMDQLDDFFAQATELPQTLAETDMTTLDGHALAQMGVIAYAPQYPLWTDDAGKLRYIRVPRGTSVVFDKTTQTFQIPPNTRFYKTFLKKVTDSDGNESYRKMETRVIVSRPDVTRDDGTVETTSLFGTYLWSEDEMSASLSNVPLNDGTGFTDRLIEYTLDEPRAQMIIDSKPANLQFALEGATGLKRHYAIPGSPRCVQCHMGSPSSSFILGFIPLQVMRRPDAVGGGYEGTGDDEMNQLQRFIDYGLVTGISSAAEITPLEQSQAPRQARNEHELLAQAYLLGNCAHCHNPRGFPSVKNPALKDVLDFMPGSSGGIFQFPLDRVSPLRVRGIDQNVPIPYITPSLREYPVAAEPNENWTPKWAGTCAEQSTDDVARLLCDGRTDNLRVHYAAPWRSLVYRNVDTPFMYADDFAIFPHMPMNSPGIDCRAPQIMGDWMVSIPAARKNPEISEDAIPSQDGKTPVDTNPQPYVEVLPDDPGYAAAVDAARVRLVNYHAGIRYSWCPDSSDIVDPAVVRAGGGQPLVPSADRVYDANDFSKLIQPGMGVPDRAHFVITDLTDVRGDWYPRRITWNDIVVDQKVETTNLPSDPDAATRELQVRHFVVDELQKVTATADLKSFALTEVPFGLWQPNAACDFAAAGVEKAGDFTGAARPQWMDLHEPAIASEAPVYMQAPGAAIFTNICINCHGPQADSHGLLSDAISNMTGGTGRVANFRAGLFGPVDDPGANRTRIFGPFARTAPPVSTADDWGARYMSFMALGGTLIQIPTALLNIVATTKVAGIARSSHRLQATASPNMLKLAQSLCLQVLPADEGNNVNQDAKLDAYFFAHGTFQWSDLTALVGDNGDAEMWRRICGFGNRVVVRVPRVSGLTADPPLVDKIDIPAAGALYFGDRDDGSMLYPADAPVLDHTGHVTNGIQPGNLFPMCLRKPKDPKQRGVLDAYLAAHPVGGAGGAIIPYCPDVLFQDPATELQSTLDDGGRRFLTDAQRWATHGAVNAGFVVFTYLDQLSRGKVSPTPPYNHCEQLKTGK